MGISEAKKKIVIDNYFKAECNINTTIKEAFTRGFELGLKKAPAPQQGEWIRTGSLGNGNAQYECSNCHYGDEQAESQEVPYCWYCGAEMKNTDPIIKAIQENNAKYDERPNIDFSRISYDLGGGEKE